jgi:hypothetical protein
MRSISEMAWRNGGVAWRSAKWRGGKMAISCNGVAISESRYHGSVKAKMASAQQWRRKREAKNGGSWRNRGVMIMAYRNGENQRYQAA